MNELQPRQAPGAQLESPRERAQRRNKEESEAYGENGKRPLSVEFARKTYTEFLDIARRGIIADRAKSDQKIMSQELGYDMPPQYVNVLMNAAHGVFAWMRQRTYDEHEAIRMEANALTRDHGFSFSDAMSYVGTLVNRMKKMDLQEAPSVDMNLSEEEEARAHHAATRMTKNTVQRMYPNGVFATKELAPYLGFSDEEVQQDEAERQLDLFRK